MYKNNFSLTIASVPDREKLIVEIYYKGDQWVELSHEENKVIAAFFPPSKQQYWEFPLDEALEVLKRAKEELLK